MFYHIKLTGNDPYQWGIQHGETLRKPIQELNKIRQDLLHSYLKTWTSDQIFELCHEHVQTLQNRYPKIYKECRGISDASGVSLENIMALNAYTDLRDFSASSPARVEDGCSIVALKGPKCNYAAQTWDMHGSATPYMLLIEVNDPEPMHVLSVTGCLGLAGVNANGLSVMINNMHCNETSRQGLVWPALVRLMLAQKNSVAAVSTLANNIPSSGHNYLLFDAENAFNVETTGLKFETTGNINNKTQNGFLIHTNHYIGNLKKYEILERQSPTTLKRQQALEEFFTSDKVDTLNSNELRTNLFIEGSVCNEICIPYSAQTPHAGATCGGLEVDHLTRKAVAFQGLYADNKKIEWTF